MDKMTDFNLEYAKIVAEKNLDEYVGPEEQAQRILPCSILEVTEIGYGNSNSINVN